MDDEQLLRYSRHILLDELGIEAQQRFLAAHVLIVGAGGLGSPVALYLAAAGIGHLTIVDPDAVDLTNLQRQILHQRSNVGMPKVISGKERIAAMNDTVEVTALTERLAGEALDRLVESVDVVVDCSDNFETRQALNRACVVHGKVLVSGAAIRFDGQVSVFDLRRDDAPCYACLFPESSEPDNVQCSVMGVFAPLTGIIGSIQAAETLKCIAGLEHTLNGRLVLFNALTMQWQDIELERDPGCPVCSHRVVSPPTTV